MELTSEIPGWAMLNAYTYFPHVQFFHMPCVVGKTLNTTIPNRASHAANGTEVLLVVLSVF